MAQTLRKTKSAGGPKAEAPSRPAAAAPAVAAARASAESAAPRANLTDLADRFGSDKGSTKHRYTELYHMLFHPFRDQAIDFLEMGLCIGGPEHGVSADRVTQDAPSVRMWLEFFPRARIHGLDVSDFAWFRHDRFRFTRCDMDARENIAKAAAGMPDFDIIIDDASHASHHQQNGFLEMFPKLRPGGLYIIEDLRWQPETYERPGITKTADLFRSFSETRRFVHGDAGVEAAFNALAPEISGCFLFQVGYDKRRRDQVAVIHRR
jgi:SAM-dependent methyltransferase